MEDRVHVGDAVWGGCGGLGAAAARGSWPPAHVGGVRSGGSEAVRAELSESGGARCGGVRAECGCGAARIGSTGQGSRPVRVCTWEWMGEGQGSTVAKRVDAAHAVCVKVCSTRDARA